MNVHLDITTTVVLALGCGAVYGAYRNERLGAAILVGIGVITLFFVLIGPSSTASQQENPKPVLSPLR